MNFARKLIALFAVVGILFSKGSLQANYCADTGGYCYEDCRRASCLAPAIALGTIALIAIIAVAVQNSGSGHGHCHD